jgi:hypothetical protein
MVFVGNRRAEQREDAVARRLDDIAIVMAYCLDHEFERRVYDRSRLLRVEVLHELS